MGGIQIPVTIDEMSFDLHIPESGNVVTSRHGLVEDVVARRNRSGRDVDIVARVEIGRASCRERV